MSAVTIRLSDYTGEISLTDKTGKDIPVSEDKKLTDGNTLSTYEESKARVLLDENRMVTIMELSSATFSGKGKKLVLELTEGSLFFNIEKPLGDDESFEISTSTMIVGIRGTSGFISTDENGNEVLYMTSGKVSVTVTDPGSDDDETEKVKAGEKLTVIITEDGIDTVIEEFSE
ncbi:MAG: FecR domain-containing protein, partial [Lachnospiraceae bacterium]|nr:FecR domain-containing protein [Lachnospiraceae bacterium]